MKSLVERLPVNLWLHIRLCYILVLEPFPLEIAEEFFSWQNIICQFQIGEDKCLSQCHRIKP